MESAPERRPPFITWNRIWALLSGGAGRLLRLSYQWGLCCRACARIQDRPEDAVVSGGISAGATNIPAPHEEPPELQVRRTGNTGHRYLFAGRRGRPGCRDRNQ